MPTIQKTYKKAVERFADHFITLLAPEATRTYLLVRLLSLSLHFSVHIAAITFRFPLKLVKNLPTFVLSYSFDFKVVFFARK